MNTDHLILALRKQQLAAMPYDVLIAHLAVQGWRPVMATTGAVQRGTERVYLIALERGLSVGYYEHSSRLDREDADWPTKPRLLMMARRIEEAEWAKNHEEVCP